MKGVSLKMRLQLIISAYDHLVSAMNWAGAILLGLLMILIVADVGGRAFFNSPIAGTPELAKICLVSILYLGIAKTLKAGRHVRGTILADRLPTGYAVSLDILANVCGFVLFTLLVYSSWHLTWSAWEIGEYEGEGSLRVPTYPLRTLVLFSSILMSIQFALNIGQDFVRLHSLTKRAP
jgi:TRAP-type C4-dicarboxylate transport system permease small subunit